MSKDRVTYGEILPIIKQDLPDEGYGEILDVGAIAKKMANYKVCRVGCTNLDFADDCSYTEWARAINQLDAFGYAATVRDCLMKWYIGDALNAGERLFGEKASQVFGPELHWKPSYVNNIRYVCRSIPKSIRTLKINNWKFWNFIAPMDFKDQEYMVEKAQSLQHFRDWYDQIRELGKQDKVLEMAAAVEDEEFKAELMDRIKTYKPTYHIARSWVDRRRLPRARCNISVWVSDNTPDGFPEEFKPMLFNMCVQLMESIHREEVVNQ